MTKTMTKTITLQPEQMEEILALLAEGQGAGTFSAPLRAHQTGHLHGLTKEQGQQLHDALEQVFDELQTRSESLHHALPLVKERILQDLQPAQDKARALKQRFDAISDFPRHERREAQLAFHAVISREMETVLNVFARKWGQDPVTLDWCDHEIGVLARTIPLTGGIMAPLGNAFAALLNPHRLGELQHQRFDNLDLRLRIIAQLNALRSLFHLPDSRPVVSLV